MDWKIVLIGLVLIGLSAFAQGAYDPYVNSGYGRPYYTQFYSPLGVYRVPPSVYSYAIAPVIAYPYYYYYYRSPAIVAAPTYAVYTPPVIPVYRAYYPVVTPYRVINQPSYTYEYEYEYESDDEDYEFEFEGKLEFDA